MTQKNARPIFSRNKKTTFQSNAGSTGIGTLDLVFSDSRIPTPT